MIILASCGGRSNPSPSPYVHAGVPCGFGYVMEKNGAQPITPDECAVILAHFEAGRLNYLARRQGLSELQRATLASYHIGYPEIYRQVPDGLMESGKPFIWSSIPEDPDRIRSNAYFNYLGQTIFYVTPQAGWTNGLDSMAHEFQHFFEYKMFPAEQRFYCIGHGNTPTCKDPLIEATTP